MQTLLSAAADKKQAPKSAPYSGKFGACFTCSVKAYASCENRMDSLYPNMLGVQRGTAPLALGHPIGVGSIPVGTRLSSESLVCYTFAFVWRRKGDPCGTCVINQLPVFGQFPSAAGKANFHQILIKSACPEKEAKVYIPFSRDFILRCFLMAAQAFYLQAAEAIGNCFHPLVQLFLHRLLLQQRHHRQ